MAERVLRTILLDAVNGMVSVLKVEDSLEMFYHHLNCDCIDIVQRKIGNKVYEVMCDQEGLHKCSPIPSALDKNLHPQLVGNLMFFNSNDEGDLVSLSEADVISIIAEIKVFMDVEGGQIHPCVMLDV